MIKRVEEIRIVEGLLKQFPVVAVVGARQVGKTTLATELARHRAQTTRFDLEDSRDTARLNDPMLELEPLRGLVIIDEVQRVPGLFQTLRVLADRPKRPARFLVLGSASPDLLRQSSETLAGRIAYHRLSGLALGEVGAGNLDRLWLRGGFPRSYLARSNPASNSWRQQFIRTFLARDLPELAAALPAQAMERFWRMLAHYHAQIWNASEIGRAFGVTHTTVARWLDALVETFMVERLQPWAENLGKRVVRAPKIYVGDSGILHSLLDIRDRAGLRSHPKVGASWEGFALSQVILHLRARPEQCYFWATHQGAELDLMVVDGRRRRGFELKRSSAPVVTKSMHIALADLRLDSLDVIHAGPHTFQLGPRMRAVPLSRLLHDVER